MLRGNQRHESIPFTSWSVAEVEETQPPILQTWKRKHREGRLTRSGRRRTGGDLDSDGAPDIIIAGTEAMDGAVYIGGNDVLFETQSIFGPHGLLSQPGLQRAMPLEGVLASLASMRGGM